MDYVRPRWARRFPEGAAESTAMTVLVSAAVGIVDMLIATRGFGDYGLVLFVIVPCVMGIGGPLLHGVGAPRKFRECLTVAILSQAALFGGMLVFGLEGLGCMVMAAPLWVGCACVGCAVAYPIHRAMWRGHVRARGFPVVGLLLFAMLPLLMGAEHAAGWRSPLMSVTSEVEIDAPPEVVWRHVLSFPELAPPRNWLYWLGTAYPIRAEIVGRGVGAERHCVFSTGAFVEPITAWEEGRRLAFDVTKCPPSMEERSFYSHLHPPHVEGYFVSKRGEFRLTALPGGGTRLEGTTWYTNEMFPVAYWRLWSDAIVHRIHMSVLEHIRDVAEGEVHRAVMVNAKVPLDAAMGEGAVGRVR